MGFALATAAAHRGANVTLISGPTHLTTPYNVRRINVETASEMLNAVQKEYKKSEIIIMSAAVADFTPRDVYSKKIKKDFYSNEEMTIALKQTEDILRFVGKNKKKNTFLVGFALETDNLIAHGRKKLSEKNLDLIVCNNAFQEGAGFSVETNIVTLIDKKGKIISLPCMQKYDVASEILNHIVQQHND